MDVPTFFKEYDRMCSYHRNGCDCGDCPLIRFIEDQRGTCLEICKRYPEKSVAIVEQWAKEHPVKTYKSVFLEMFPNVKTTKEGHPDFCLKRLLGAKGEYDICSCDITCGDCWSREVEE